MTNDGKEMFIPMSPDKPTIAPRKQALIEIWRFDDAPQEWRELSQHGGDEDYIVLMDTLLADTSWIGEVVVERVTVCNRERYDLPGGQTIFITAHA